MHVGVFYISLKGIHVHYKATVYLSIPPAIEITQEGEGVIWQSDWC